MKKKLCALALCALVLCGCGVGPTSTSAPSSAPESAQEVPEAPPEPTALERARERLAALTVEEKVGQMFFARRPERGSAEDAAAWHLGGYVLFGRDYEDSEGNYLTREAFLQSIQADQTAAKADTGIPLLIGSDAVSYTHLDVYKRQAHDRGPGPRHRPGHRAAGKRRPGPAPL